MFNLLSREYLEDLHFDKPTLNPDLKFKYKNCNYKIYIPFAGLSKFGSIALETLYDGKRKAFSIVSDRKDHDHKDREQVGNFIHLLAMKYKYDLSRGIEESKAGFLHIHEIQRLSANGYTNVPTSIYRGLKRLYRSAQKSKASPEYRFLSKFLFDTDQLFHLICWCGKVGLDTQDLEKNTIFWLNLPAKNIEIRDERGNISDNELKKHLGKLFPEQCLLTEDEVERVIEELTERYPGRIPLFGFQKQKRLPADEIADSRLVEFRQKLKEEADQHLKKNFIRGLMIINHWI